MSSPRTAKAVRRSKTAPAKPAAKGAGAALCAEASRVAVEIERALADGRLDALTPAAVQGLMAAVCRIYSAQIEAGGRFLPVKRRSGVTSTDVMLTASGLLRSSNLAVFELGMWQSWTGR